MYITRAKVEAMLKEKTAVGYLGSAWNTTKNDDKSEWHANNFLYHWLVSTT
jgi:hypothetical protein